MARNRNGSFPPSVQPGIPSLDPLPKGWHIRQLGSCIVEVKRPIRLIDDRVYSLITVKRGRGGAVKRAELAGKDIKVKAQFRVKPGDFLISKRQIVHGACAIVPPELKDSIVSNEYAVINCKEEVDIQFLKYLSETTYFQQTCFHSSIGVHVEKMVFNFEKWLKWQFNIPPLAEQRKISRTLSTWDAAIDCVQRLLENSRQQKKALMQQLLTGKQRLPGFNLRWKQDKLSKHGCFQSGECFPLAYQGKRNGNYPFFKVSDMNHPENNRLMITANNWIDKDVHDVLNFKLLPPRGIVFAKIGAAINLERKRMLQRESIIDNNMMCFTVDDSEDANFYYYVFLSLQLNKYASTTALPSLNSKDLNNIEVHIPCRAEQFAIASVLMKQDEIVDTYAKMHNNFLQQKKALMQQLLTGKRRVKPDPEDYGTE